MMNVEQIQERLAALVAAMMDKGLSRPRADLTLAANSAPAVYISSPDLTSGQFNHGDTVEQCFVNAEKIISAMPKPQDVKMHLHMKRVADCIDKGREDGIDDAYIAPLVVVKAAMTENLLTKQVAL